MNKTIYLCGPLAPEGQPPNGGYAAANARTLAALRSQQRSVQAMPYPAPVGGGLAKLLGYVSGFRRLLRQLELQAPGVLHITGLYKQFVLPELLLLRKARRLGYLTVYDIRAGSMLLYYQRLGAVYQALFRRVLREADRVMVEGREYESFVQQLTGQAPFYFPNHVELASLADRTSPPAGESPVLIYVGRVNLDKGIATLLEAARVLGKRGSPVRVWIVGPAEAALQQALARDYPDVDAQWLGSRSSQAVLDLLAQAHFFIFPTRHRGEGHSNALTEAMSMGCVPLASKNGFNASVIDDAGIILPLEADGAAYASAVSDIWSQGRWLALSLKARARAQAHYGSPAVIGRLQDEYRMLEQRG